MSTNNIVDACVHDSSILQDGATTNDEDRLLVIGATNRPQEIDEAARRRLVKRLYIPLPDAEARKQIVSNLMKQQPFSLSEDEMEELCKQSEGEGCHSMRHYKVLQNCCNRQGTLYVLLK